MKKIIALILALVMTVSLMAGCSAPDDGTAAESVSVDSLKTFGDILAIDTEEEQTSLYENNAIFVFKLGDDYYRAVSKPDQSVYDSLWDLDYDDEKYEEKRTELYNSVKIDKIEKLNDQILTKEELDALVGKTGQELLDDGWYSNGYNLEDMEFWMGYGPFLYRVFFNGQVAEADHDTFSEYEDMKDFTVKSAEFYMLGDATDINQ